MLACVDGSMLWMNNLQVQSFRALDSFQLTLYIANLGINVIFIGVAQQRKPKFSLPCKILTELSNSPSKNIPIFQNADSCFLMNTVICSILTLFKSCKHRHQYYIGIIQIFELRIFSKDLWPQDVHSAHETCNIIPRAPHGFTHD